MCEQNRTFSLANNIHFFEGRADATEQPAIVATGYGFGCDGCTGERGIARFRAAWVVSEMVGMAYQTGHKIRCDNFTAGWCAIGLKFSEKHQDPDHDECHSDDPLKPLGWDKLG